MKKGILSLLCLFACVAVRAQVRVHAGAAAAALVETLSGPGVTIRNVNLNCAAWAAGTFSVVSSNLPIDSGVVLTNGNAALVPGPSAILASLNNGAPGDADLTQLAGQSTHDACILEFDVIPQGDTISFDYVFSSEEYINAVCGPYNDVFGFFISGPGITGRQNMALVPGTTIPVTINSINNGIPGSTGSLDNCTKMGPGSPFTAYYIDNSTGSTITHRGMTTVLQAVHGVQKCGQYHLKLAIADAGNSIYDSGVFLKAGSLRSDNYTVDAIRPLPADTLAFCMKGCLPGHFVIKRSKPASQPQAVHFIMGGNAIAGLDYAPIPDSVVIPAYASSADVWVYGLPTPLSGPRLLQLFLLTPGTCSGLNNIIDTAGLMIYDTLHLSILNPCNTVCQGQPVHMQVLGDSIVRYQWRPVMYVDNPVRSQPTIYPGEDMVYTVTASLPGTNCPVKTATAVINTRLTPRLALPRTLSVCNNAALPLVAATSQPNQYYTYQWTGPNGFSSTLYDATIPHSSPAYQGTYQLTVTIDTNQCSRTGVIDVAVTVPPQPGGESAFVVCRRDETKPLPVDGANLAWYTADTSAATIAYPDYSTDTVATYRYYVTQTIDGCESVRKPIAVTVKRCCDGRITIPNAFTPNGDGVNDLFRALPDYGYFATKVTIVNRWGQLIYSGLDGTWDGTVNGAPADLGTYFYRITFGCIRGGKEDRQGDVLLLR